MTTRARGHRSALATAVAVTILVALAAGPAMTRAQDDPPEPGRKAVTFLPSAGAFGPGWRRFDPAAVANLPADTFTEGATVVYGGPEGARVILTVLLVDEGRVRRGWEAAGTLYDNVRYNLTYDYAREEQIRNVPPPPGCAEAKRLEGRLYFDGFETGVTLCAVDPDLILLAIASGRVDDETGFAAADSVIEAALTAADATPPADDDDEAAVTGAKIALEAFDIGWSDARLLAEPGDTNVVTNTGAAPHSFVIEALGISVEVAAGETVEAAIPLDAKPGRYPFVCGVPGHDQAGLTGELVLE